MVMVKGKLQTKLTKINSGKEGRRKVSGKGSGPTVKSKQKCLFGAGVNYKVVVNVFVWIYRNLIKRLWCPL